MVELRKESVSSDSNLKRKEDSDLTSHHHPIHSNCCHRHGSVALDTSDQRGHSPPSSNMGSKESGSMVMMDKDTVKVVAYNAGQETTTQNKEQILGNGVGVVVEVLPEENKPVTVTQEHHTQEKIVHMVSIVTIIMISLSLVSFQWLLPYYYSVSAPLLLVIRFVQYWKLKFQFYLLDFCYFANITALVFIWAYPDNGIFFTILFGLVNGPQTWAVVLFRNSAVFHSIDKMTSTFIHVLPPYVLYCVRWYPQITSEYWYKPFIGQFDKDIGYMFLWLLAVPFACFVFHSLLYLLLVYGIFKPSEEYDTSFKHISTKTSFKVCTGALGPNYHFLMYNLFNYVYCIVSLVFTPLWYISFPAHSAYLAAATFAAFWNGAGYYQEVFRKRCPKTGKPVEKDGETNA